MKVKKIIRENLGLKIGLMTGFAVFLVVVLLMAIFIVVQSPLISKLSVIQVFVILGILLTLFSVLVVSIAMNLLVERPLNRLISVMRQAETGDLKSRAIVESNDEVGEVTTQFNEMLEKVRALEENKIKIERDLTIAQEELRYKELLEKNAETINKTNQRLEESLKELSILYKVSQTLTTSLDPEELCQLLGQVIPQEIGIEDFAILLLNPETGKLEVKTALGFDNNAKVKSLSFELGEGVSGRVARDRKAIYIPDTTQDEIYLHYKGAQNGKGSFLCLPMLVKDQVLGSVNFSRADTHAFSESEIRLLTTIVGQSAIVLENAKLYAKTKELTLLDDLTHVYNRRYFHKMIELECKRARRFQRPLSLLMIDVDYFKKFNDSFGHLEGDQLLKRLAETLSQNLREIDTIARYGGEEFTVILANTDTHDAHTVASKLKEKVEAMPSTILASPEAKVTISIGIADFNPEKDHVEDLIHHADIALYRAKSKGRNSVVIYEEPIQLSLQETVLRH